MCTDLKILKESNVLIQVIVVIVVIVTEVVIIIIITIIIIIIIIIIIMMMMMMIMMMMIFLIKLRCPENKTLHRHVYDHAPKMPWREILVNSIY